MVQKFLNNEKGISEFIGGTVVIFILSFFMVATMVVAQMWDIKIAVQEAAFEAARQGSVSDTPVQTAQRVAWDFGRKTIRNWDWTRVNATATVTGNYPNQYLIVTVRYYFPVPVINQTWQTVGVARMRIEGQP